LAFTFANAIAYVDSAVKAGLDVDVFAGQLSFFFNVHNDFFEEIAKFRAARRIWARLMKERFGAKDPRSQMLRFHSQTAGSTLTAQQPENNVVRVAVQALASVLGGTQSLHTKSMDEGLALPSESAALIALRTQQVIASEPQVTQTVDPLAGSYFVESLTATIEDGVWKYLSEIEAKGGTVSCIESGYIQNEILNSAYDDQKRMDSKGLEVVGVNVHQETGSAKKIEILKVPAELETRAIERIRAYRAKRSEGRARDALRALSDGAKGEANLMALVHQCVKSECTLGEISDSLRVVFGEYQEYSGF
jgi:methylmalonyl-CoA mutase N-terminal domain/subunit